MKYKLLQVGDVIQEGDEGFDPVIGEWCMVPVNREVVTAEGINDGWFVRRPEGALERTVCVETHTTCTRVMTVTRLDAELYLTGGLDTGFRVPLSCVEDVVKAIKEVAGI